MPGCPAPGTGFRCSPWEGNLSSCGNTVPAPWSPCGAGGTEGTLPARTGRAQGAGTALTGAPPAAPRSPSPAAAPGQLLPVPTLSCSALPAALRLRLRLDNATAFPLDTAGLRSGAASCPCSAVTPCWCCGQMCLQGVQQRGQHPPGCRVRGQGWRGTGTGRDGDGKHPPCPLLPAQLQDKRQHTQPALASVMF